MDCVSNGIEPGYFQSMADNFTTLDSVVYEPQYPLAGIQATVRCEIGGGLSL